MMEQIMSNHIKTPLEKLETRINKAIQNDDNLTREKNKLKIYEYLLLDFDDESIRYSKNRYYPSRKSEIEKEEFYVTIVLNHENLDLLSSNILKPPQKSKIVLKTITNITNNEITNIIIGSDRNEINSGSIYITSELYSTISKIINEENNNAKNRVNERIYPFILNQFDFDLDGFEFTNKIDYSLMLKDILTNGDLTQKDLIPLMDFFDEGHTNEIVIEKQVNKQVKWLVDTIQNIIDEPNISKTKAKEFGYRYFSFKKKDIIGAESLMELILTKYGRNTFFGVPKLLNTNKYVLSTTGLPRCQFDIILLNYLNDIVVVELKRPDKVILDYDESRRKFYPSKDLAIAIGQSERYITTFNKSHDENFKIDGRTIIEYLESEIGGSIEDLNICRPTALIIMGTIDKVSKEYEKITPKYRTDLTKEDYEKNSFQAYNELKNSFKNINILTYSELLENARLRLINS